MCMSSKNKKHFKLNMDITFTTQKILHRNTTERKKVKIF